MVSRLFLRFPGYGPKLSALVVAGLASALVSASCARAQSLPAASHASAPSSPNYVFLSPAASEAEEPSASPNDGAHQGIKLHGHWVIDVKNPDGSVAQHRDFENSLSGGQIYLIQLLSFQAVPQDYGIFLTNGTNTAPCASATVQGCGIVRSLTTLPGSYECSSSGDNYYCGTGLTYSTNYTTFTLTGGITATQAGQVSNVATFVGSCSIATNGTYETGSPSACNNNTVSGNYSNQFTYATLASPISVVTGQLIQVTVTFSFS